MYLVVPYSLSRQQKTHAEVILNRFVLGEWGAIVVSQEIPAKLCKFRSVKHYAVNQPDLFVRGDQKSIHLGGILGRVTQLSPQNVSNVVHAFSRVSCQQLRQASNSAMVQPWVLYKVLMLFSCQGYNLPLFQNLVSRVESSRFVKKAVAWSFC